MGALTDGPPTSPAYKRARRPHQCLVAGQTRDPPPRTGARCWEAPATARDRRGCPQPSGHLPLAKGLQTLDILAPGA